MQVKPEVFPELLEKGLKQIYLVSGDEELLLNEFSDQLISKARSEGFTERKIIHVERGFSWKSLEQELSSMSLFAEKRILELRLPASKFDKEASEVIRNIVSDHVRWRDNLILFRTERLQPRQRSSAWFKAIDSIGIICLVWPIEPSQFPRWLAARAAQRGIRLDGEALHYLTDKVEGNLLAADQELSKIELMQFKPPIGLTDLVASLEDASHFSTFDLIDLVFAGDSKKVLKAVRLLRFEGVSIFAILGALTSQLRRINEPRGLPQGRLRAMQSFKQRSNFSLYDWLAECSVVDSAGKGLLRGDEWIYLEHLLMVMSGINAIEPPSRIAELVSCH